MKHGLVILNIVLCVLSVMVVYFTFDFKGNVSTDKETLRQARIELQRLQQTIKYLENAKYTDLITSLEASLNELKISVAEFVSNEHEFAHISEVVFQLEPREAVLLPQHSYPIHSIRMNVKFKAASVAVLANYLQSLGNSVSPWPIEVRACDIHRLLVNKILANCFLDIHYWEEA